ncbi:hypothetical protein GCM10009416_47240 [Craurococcus roseus]|uniref:Beta-phosphoglucomutase family hydrolase n=1 Tax=Craurococcus roseus TaxID=77585 RepID=A0ABN1G569_9PROT
MADNLAPSIEGAPVLDLAEFDGAAFDLDGVITRTATVHAAAWKRLFDAFLARRAARMREEFRPFDAEGDYLRHVDGKPRLDGVRDFLRSRAIVLPDGEPDDPPERETVCSLGNGKDALFRQLLARKGVEVFDGSVAFIRRLRGAGLKTAVVSASKNTVPILKAAGLADLFDACVDGVEAERLGLEGKPSPDTFLHAAKVLGVPPKRILGVEDSLAGVEAIRAAGFGLAVGVDRTGHGAALAAHGAGVVVPDLTALHLRAKEAGDPARDLRVREGAQACGPSADLPLWPSADPEWVLVEEGFTPTREHEVESLFTIGNGYIGSRAALAEGSSLSAPETFIAGVFDTRPGASPELATLPEWEHLSITVEGQPLRLDLGRFLEHRRILDLRQAIVWREWQHQDAAGRLTRIRGLRLASAADRHLLVGSVAFSPENFSGLMSLDASIGGLVSKRTATGAAVALAAATRFIGFDRTTAAEDRATPRPLRVDLGKVYRLDRVVAVHTSRDSGSPELVAREHADRAIESELAALIDGHRSAWMERWRASDVRIGGDPAAQRALRFAIYHLLSAANPEDERTSIGARGLTGSAYKGHVFWDTEIFMLPFFTLTYPEAARALLKYRYHTLPAARRRAAQFGHRGALYAWESADTGEDVTPSLVSLPGGETIRVLTGEQEQHISADVAYAVWSYWHATGDQEFLLGAGAEILLETARFWASRAERGEDGRCHIRGVIGPDEYHETVDDNAYTNGMAKWNLLTGERVARLVAERWPERWQALSAGIGLRPDEPAEWLTVARDMYTGLDEATGLMEQFRGYFELEDIDLGAFEPRNAPVDVLLGRERVQRSKIIKQPDVVMLLHLLWDDYPPAVREANFRYYEPRCAHGSSLSPAIHALVAARLGDPELATRYFRQAVDIDLADNMGNAAGGVHAAALGGLWQAVVFGFAGLRLTDHGPEHHPNLPPHWGGLSMRIMWRGRTHDLNLPPAGGAAGPQPGRRSDG